jgi:small subunit ribosomal protein S16
LAIEGVKQRMSVKIRLARVGRRKAPYYRIVVADSRRARDGRFIEIVGRYQPLQKDANQLHVDEARALKWLGDGAVPSDTVRSIFRRLGIMRRWHEQRVAKKKEPTEATASPGGA